MTAIQALSYDAAPPLSAPLRFFLTAPLFGIAAGLVLLLGDGALLTSRWTPAALALTHLIAVGFMLNVMLGALLQILPVVAGARIPLPRVTAGVVHLGIGIGAIALVAGLGLGMPGLLGTAGLLLGASAAVFLASALRSLSRIAVTQATSRDLRIALIGLMATVVLGAGMALGLAGTIDFPLPLADMLQLHIGWAWLGWSGLLLAATSWVVVPMFQITPSYPALMTRLWAPTVCAVLLLWSALSASAQGTAASLLEAMLLALAAAFAVLTLERLARTRRTRPDASRRGFQLAMGSVLAGLLCLLAGAFVEIEAVPVIAAILILHGGFVSAIMAMLAKIVPFLAWLHLTEARVKAPNVKQLLPEAAIKRLLAVHAASLPLLLAAATGNVPAVRLAGLVVIVEFGLLLANMCVVLLAYRKARGRAA